MNQTPLFPPPGLAKTPGTWFLLGYNHMVLVVVLCSRIALLPVLTPTGRFPTEKVDLAPKESIPQS
jgi:hypothetical protein